MEDNYIEILENELNNLEYGKDLFEVEESFVDITSRVNQVKRYFDKMNDRIKSSADKVLQNAFRTYPRRVTYNEEIDSKLKKILEFRKKGIHNLYIHDYTRGIAKIDGIYNTINDKIKILVNKKYSNLENIAMDIIDFKSYIKECDNTLESICDEIHYMNIKSIEQRLDSTNNYDKKVVIIFDRTVKMLVFLRTKSIECIKNDEKEKSDMLNRVSNYIASFSTKWVTFFENHVVIELANENETY